MKRAFVAITVIVLLGAAGGVAWFRQRQGERADESYLRLYGNVDIREVELAFEAQGRIEQVEAEEGDQIEKDQLLATLDDTRFRHEVDRAKAREESQRQVVTELEAGTRTEEIRQAEADVEAAEARLVQARRDRDRTAALVESRAATPEELDDVTAAYETAVAEVRVARAALDLAEAGPREEEIAAARARLRQLEADSALAEWALEQTRLAAPDGGILRNRILEPGDMATRDRPAFTLALTDPIWVRAYVDGPDLGKLRPGMRAQVVTDSFPEKHYEGWIGFISPTAEFTPKTVQTEELRTQLVYEVRIYVHNPQGELRLGMPATVFIPRDQEEAEP